MNIFDYMNLVSGYIINTLENKRDLNEIINFEIKPIRVSDTNDLFYEVVETDNLKNQIFYLKFPCNNKDDFYEMVNALLVEYLKNSDLLMYSSTNNSVGMHKTFSMVTNNRASITFCLEDDKDVLVFDQIKKYLDTAKRVEEISKINENDTFAYEEELEVVPIYQKI